MLTLDENLGLEVDGGPSILIFNISPNPLTIDLDFGLDNCEFRKYIIHIHKSSTLRRLLYP